MNKSVLKVFAPRQVIMNRKGAPDGILDIEYTENEEDPEVDKLRSTINTLRGQVRQLTIGKAEIDKDYMNMLSSMAKEKDEEIESMKADIESTEKANAFLKEAKDSLVERVLELEQELAKCHELLDKESLSIEGTKSASPNELLSQNKEHAYSNSETTSKLVRRAQSSDISILEVTNNHEEKCNDLWDRNIVTKTDRLVIVDKSNEVDQTELLKEQIRMMQVREDAANRHLAKIMQDADNLHFRQNLTIDLLNAEIAAYREETMRLEKVVMTIEMFSHQSESNANIEEKDNESTSSLKRVREKEIEDKVSVKLDNATQLSEERNIITMEPSVPLQPEGDGNPQLNDVPCPQQTETKPTYREEAGKTLDKVKQENGNVESTSLDGGGSLETLSPKEGTSDLNENVVVLPYIENIGDGVITERTTNTIERPSKMNNDGSLSIDTENNNDIFENDKKQNHDLRELDIELVKLSDVELNVIPVIGKTENSINQNGNTVEKVCGYPQMCSHLELQPAENEAIQTEAESCNEFYHDEHTIANDMTKL